MIYEVSDIIPYYTCIYTCNINVCVYTLIISNSGNRFLKYIAKVTNKVKLSDKTKRKAAEIMSSVMKEGISAGKDPMGLAASVLYLSSIKNKDTITQSNIAEAAGVTEVTVRTRAKELRKKNLI